VSKRNSFGSFRGATFTLEHRSSSNFANIIIDVKNFFSLFHQVLFPEKKIGKKILIKCHILSWQYPFKNPIQIVIENLESFFSAEKTNISLKNNSKK
jgi:hypothetical protein